VCVVDVCTCLGCMGLSGFVMVCDSNVCDVRHFGARVGASSMHYISEGFERTLVSENPERHMFFILLDPLGVRVNFLCDCFV